MAVRATTTLTADTQDALEELQEFAEDVGLPFTIRSTRRTCDEQRALFAMGRTAPGNIVTNAQGCMSWHVLGRAVDITIPGGVRSDYERLGEFWESIGGHWGGRFTTLDDPGHYEWHPGMTIEQICPNPAACEETVEAHIAASDRSRLPLGGMLAVAGMAAATMIWWKG